MSQGAGAGAEVDQRRRGAQAEALKKSQLFCWIDAGFAVIAGDVLDIEVLGPSVEIGRAHV